MMSNIGGISDPRDPTPWTATDFVISKEIAVLYAGAIGP